MLAKKCSSGFFGFFSLRSQRLVDVGHNLRGAGAGGVVVGRDDDLGQLVDHAELGGGEKAQSGLRREGRGRHRTGSQPEQFASRMLFHQMFPFLSSSAR